MHPWSYVNQSSASQSLRKDEPYLILIHFILFSPDIESVKPATGGMNGGTLLTIKGKGFGAAKDNIKIDIAGLPCVVQSNTATEIICKTSKAVPSDLAPTNYAGTVL